MTKRLIGIDIGLQSLRLAVLGSDKGKVSLISIEESRHDGTLLQQLEQQGTLAGDFRLGDRLATCLPSGAAFIRRLAFPFGDRRKILAALPFELSAQLPVALDDYTTAMQPPIQHDGQSQVIAAAIKSDRLADFLEPFDTLGIPLHILDLAPHAYVAGLKNHLNDGILVCAMEHGTSLALISSGEVIDYKHLPLTSETPVAGQARAIHRECTALGHAEHPHGAPVQLMGPQASEELVTALNELHDKVELLCIDIDGQRIEAPFLPAVALALRAEEAGKAQAFNLRQGRFALKGEWVSLRKALLIAACLAVLTLVTLFTSMGLRYYDRQQQVDKLDQQLATIYRQTFPNADTVVNVPMQMKSAVIRLQEELGVVDLERPSPLQLLDALSNLPESLGIDVDELHMEGDEVRISGRAVTFEAVNRIAEIFRQSPGFAKVEVAESKMDLAGKGINYRMNLTLSGKGASL